MGSKVMQDAVHGLIQLEPIVIKFIDTPEFQRLRGIKQVGLCQFVYPTCQHTRFEHCLGTYHLAKLLIESINMDEKYLGPKFTKQEEVAIKIASLCHDLGHGPFSHLWERFVKSGGSNYAKYKHEVLSTLILERIIRTNPDIQKSLDEYGVDMLFIKSLILGKPELYKPAEYKQRPFIYEVLSNESNGVDVDKWDYLLRDLLHAGLGSAGLDMDVQRFLRFLRPVLHNEIDHSNTGDKFYSNACWHLSLRDTELENMFRAFTLRQHLQQKIYQHKVVMSISCMLSDALESIEPYTQLRQISMKAIKSQNPNDLDEFLVLQDSLFWDIYNGSGLCTITNGNNDEERKISFKNAKDLIHRILIRDLYPYIDTVYSVYFNDNMNEHKSNQLLNHSFSCDSTKSIMNERERRESIYYEPVPSHYKTLGDSYKFLDQTAKHALLEEIFLKLPPDSGVSNINELILSESCFTSNSTHTSPKFFFYTKMGKVFIYEQPLRILKAYRLYWCAGKSSKKIENKTDQTKNAKTIKYLFKAFETWYKEKIQQSYTNI